MVHCHIGLIKVPGLYYMTKSDSRVQVTGCGSCGYSLLSLEVFSPGQILLIVQTTTIAQCFLSLFFLDFLILESKKRVTFILLFCFIFWSSISFSVLLSVISVLHVFLSFPLLYNLQLLSVSFCSFMCYFLPSILFTLLFFSTCLSVPCSVLFFSIYSLIYWSPLLFSFKICYRF